MPFHRWVRCNRTGPCDLKIHTRRSHQRRLRQLSGGSTVTELDLAIGYGAIIRQAEEQKGLHQPGEPFHIHSCLQGSQWKDMDDDEDWEAILPSVELASRFLDDPAITPFFCWHGGQQC